MDNTVVYKERKTYTRYDNEHYMLYTKEQKAVYTPDAENTGDEDAKPAEPVEGYSYTGAMPDGGMLVRSTDVNDDNRRGKFIAGLIGTRYSIDDQLAILANAHDTDIHKSEYDEFERFRAECKMEVDRMLAR